MNTKTEEEKRAAFNALSGREQAECEGLSELLDEHLGIEVSCYDVVDLNQAIKWNLDSLDEMEATPMRGFPSIDWHEKCKELERELTKAREEIALWSKSYVSRYGGKEAHIDGSGAVTLLDYDERRTWRTKV